jgi:hypothetical protein
MIIYNYKNQNDKVYNWHESSQLNSEEKFPFSTDQSAINLLTIDIKTKYTPRTVVQLSI